MYKNLLLVGMSTLMLASYSWSQPPEWSGPSELVVEDPHKIVTGLSSAVENSKILLQWKVSGKLPGFFAIERSTNGKDYEVVTVLNNLLNQSQYRWTDEAPAKGQNFYRLRYTNDQNKVLYSKTITEVVTAESGCKFYPNPVDHILIIRSDMLVDVQISDPAGKARITENRVRGLYTLNVSSLERGIYIIRFTNKLTNVISQEKLIKN